MQDPAFCAEMLGYALQGAAAARGDACMVAQADEAADQLLAAGAVLGMVAMVMPTGAVKNVVRIRHYTNSRGLKGIKEAGIIRASDKNRVFGEAANRKPLPPHVAEDKYGLKRGRGRNYVETDVPADQVERHYNPNTESWELRVPGDLPLNNPTFHER